MRVIGGFLPSDEDRAKTLGRFAREIDDDDREFAQFCRGYDHCARLDNQRTSADPPTKAWLWGHYTNQIES